MASRREQTLARRDEQTAGMPIAVAHRPVAMSPGFECFLRPPPALQGAAATATARAEAARWMGCPWMRPRKKAERGPTQMVFVDDVLGNSHDGAARAS